jgi:hypothetical protein
MPEHDCEAARWPRRYQRVDLMLGHEGDADGGDPHPGALLREIGAAETSTADAVVQDPASDPEEFLRLWTEALSEEDGSRETAGFSSLFSLRVLQGAVIGNGGALVLLALLMAAPGVSKAGLMTGAIVLGLGLIFAAVSVVASVNFHEVQVRLARIAAPPWLATASGAVSFTALALALPLLLITR